MHQLCPGCMRAALEIAPHPPPAGYTPPGRFGHLQQSGSLQAGRRAGMQQHTCIFCTLADAEMSSSPRRRLPHPYWRWDLGAPGGRGEGGGGGAPRKAKDDRPEGLQLAVRSRSVSTGSQWARYTRARRRRAPPPGSPSPAGRRHPLLRALAPSPSMHHRARLLSQHHMAHFALQALSFWIASVFS